MRFHPRALGSPVATRVVAAGPWRISERHAGEGPAVALVHGLAVSGRYFVPTIGALSPWFSCRAPDLPGFGHSPGPRRPLGVRGLADALADWLRATGGQNAALLGNSAGCQFIVDCAARHDDIIGPVILVGPTTDPAARTAPRQVGRWLRTGLSTDIAQVPLLAVDVPEAGLRRVASTFRSVLADRIEDKLPRLRRPVLVVRGGRDRLVPQRWADEVARLAPDGRVAVVDGGAHVVNLTHPRALAGIVRTFLWSLEGWPGQRRAADG